MKVQRLIRALVLSCSRTIVRAHVISLLGFFVVSCSAGGNRTTWEYMPDMTNSPAVKAQEEPMRVPPEGTVPRGFDPYPYAIDQGDLAGAKLKNPVAQSKESLMRGQFVFNYTCVVCHGPKGNGEGSIVPKFPRPPSLLSEKVRGWSDGRIYHVITRGQNLMSSYASQIPAEDRWAVIHYVRALQRAAQPSAEDIEAFKKALQEKTYP